MSYRSIGFCRWPQGVWLFVVLLVALLTHSHAAERVTLAWDPDPDAAGYRLHYGTVSGSYSKTIDVGNNATATLSDLTSGVTCFCAVTAYNAAGLESPPSEEYSFLVATRSRATRPAAPQGTTAAPSTPAPQARPQRPQAPLQGSTGNQTVPTPQARPQRPQAPLQGSTANQLTANQLALTTPSITALRRLQDGSFQFTVTSTPGAVHGVSVYFSGNLKNWTLLTNAVSPTGTLLVTDPAAASVARRFYRVSTP